MQTECPVCGSIQIVSTQRDQLTVYTCRSCQHEFVEDKKNDLQEENTVEHGIRQLREFLFVFRDYQLALHTAQELARVSHDLEVRFYYALVNYVSTTKNSALQAYLNVLSADDCSHLAKASPESQKSMMSDAIRCMKTLQETRILPKVLEKTGC